MMDRRITALLATCAIATAAAGCKQIAPKPPATSCPTLVAVQAAPDEGFVLAGDEPASVVYVIDRSGSMLDYLGPVRKNVVASFGRLSAQQQFHLLFYNGQVVQGPSIDKALTRANDDNKYAAWRFVEDQPAHGQGNPLPAIERAFAVLQSARGRKIIHFVSDGTFPDNDALLAAVERLTMAQDVEVHTYLCGSGTEMTQIVLKRIAQLSGGQFRPLPNK